jgi:UDP-GlcNAc3NAcA epimerase
MLKILTVVGARPQIIKAAALSRAIRDKFSSRIKEVIVHTGQHYDENMSQVFFDELGIPAPDHNLQVGSGTHGEQTAAMITGIEKILLSEKPGCIILYGDTNSTLAGAIAASKIHVPIVHIEAGLRSFSKAMPEEVNRILCDHVSTLLFSPTLTGLKNLIKEGFAEANAGPFTCDNPRIYHCGDVMYDNSLYFSALAEKRTDIVQREKLIPGKYVLATIHRNNNTDEPARLNALFTALNGISEKNGIQVVLPMHPRTTKLLDKNLSQTLLEAVKKNPLFRIMPPASFLEMTALEKNARLIMTDSGGVQKEAFFFSKPCIILRPETEWVELVECGAAVIADANESAILKAFEHFKDPAQASYPSIFGNGKAAEFICGELLANLAG